MLSTSQIPSISVILPVAEDCRSFDRAIQSVVDQTFSDWELLVLDDGSNEETQSSINVWTTRDARIRALRIDEPSGFGAARNLGLSIARGDFIAYLDENDEYDSDYLDRVASHSANNDVLVFGYDVVHGNGTSNVQKGNAAVETYTWNPAQFRHNLFARPIAALLGIAHRRVLFEKVGGFNELLWEGEDWDFLKRIARMGVDFMFLEDRSGKRYLQTEKSDHPPRVTRKQREILESNRRSGKPLFGGRPKTARKTPVQKIAFASPHSLIDFYNGAALATSHGLQFLQSQGFECQAFCGSRLDSPEESLVEELLAKQQSPYDVRKTKIGDYDARMIFTRQGEVPVTLFGSASTRGRWMNESEASAFLRAFTIFLDKNRPDVVLTYGGDPVSLSMIDVAKSRDLPVVFMLHNCQYNHPAPFASVDYATVPSEFCRQFYWDTLGLACHRVPNIIDWQRIEVADRKPQYVTFVNPHPAKGLFVFARLAEVLGRRRPDIPLLIVEGRGQANLLQHANLDLSGLINLHRMEVTPDPRHFYKVSKLVLVPSLCNEAAPLIPIESMINGIPVLGSNRGGVPEMIGKGGFVFDIPAQYSMTTDTVPTAEEVEPWVDTIIRLWDDAAFFEQAVRNAKEEAQRWHPSRQAPFYKEFFSTLFHQPAPPFVLRDRISVLPDST